MIKGVAHVGVSTKNIEKLIDFYCDVLGFEVVMEQSKWEPKTEFGNAMDEVIGFKNSAAKFAMVGKGSFVLEIFEYSSPEPKSKANDWKACDIGFTHICLDVEDIDSEYERLKKAGMTFMAPPGEPIHGLRAVYGIDPEGHIIELWETLPVPAE